MISHTWIDNERDERQVFISLWNGPSGFSITLTMTRSEARDLMGSIAVAFSNDALQVKETPAIGIPEHPYFAEQEHKARMLEQGLCPTHGDKLHEDECVSCQRDKNGEWL